MVEGENRLLQLAPDLHTHPEAHACEDYVHACTDAHVHTTSMSIKTTVTRICLVYEQGLSRSNT